MRLLTFGYGLRITRGGGGRPPLNGSYIIASRYRDLIAVAAFALVFSVTTEAQVLVVASNGEHHAALVNANTYQVFAKLPTGKGPHEIAISPDGRTAYVAISGAGPQGEPGNTITVIDIQARTVKATFDLGTYKQPHDLRVSRDGSLLWVTCAPAKKVLELDARSGKILREWDFKQEGGWMLAVTPDDRKIYVANLEGGSVSIIERATGAARTIALSTGQIGIDVSPNGREVWVSDLQKNVISVIDAATDRVVASFDSGGKGAVRVKFTPDGSKVLVPHGASKTLAVFDAASRKLVKTVELPAPPKVITISGDGKRAFLTSPAANQVTVVGQINYSVSGTFPISKIPDGIAWSNAPIISSAMSASSSYSDLFPAWSRDGRKIAYTSNKDGDPEIYIMNADGSNPVRLTNSPGRDAHPAWSPDGRKIAFQSPRGGQDTHLYVMNADGSDLKRLTNNSGFSGVPAWSPDGKKIVFQLRGRDTDGRWQIYVINADGSNQRRLTNTPANDQAPNWSPNGTRLVFFSDRAGKNQIYVMDADGSNVRRITNNSYDDRNVAWSPDGKRLVFASIRDGEPGVYMMDADGSRQVKVIGNIVAHSLSFSPDGAKILFSSNQDGMGGDIYVANADGSQITMLSRR